MSLIPTMPRVRKIHFVGIGGSGMNGIAEVLHTQGYSVSGSDTKENEATKRLSSKGISIFIGHTAENIKGSDVLVVSSAISSSNPEVLAAKHLSIPILSRAEMLAELMRFYQYSVAVAGTHGKTTTTSLIASIFAQGGLDPTFVIGGILTSLGGNARLGASQYFVAEADESDASFLYFNPTIAVVTNIEADHMQTYNNDFSCLKQAFVDFLHKMPFYGLAVLCLDSPGVKDILPIISRNMITYGFDRQADIWAEDVKQNEMVTNFRVLFKSGEDPWIVHLNLPGKHNVLNALAAIAVSKACGIHKEYILQALYEFKGVGRRLQLHGDAHLGEKKITVIDDYGHHPSEIEVSLAALRQSWPNRRIVLVFQPHRYTRTQSLFDDFVKALEQADSLLLLNIYSAGEGVIDGVSSAALLESIRKRGKKDIHLISGQDVLLDVLSKILKHGDVLLLQGAGDIGNFAPRIMKEFSDS